MVSISVIASTFHDAAPHPFSLRQLQYLVAVADTLSFRKAAELCNVSQPSLSAQLAELESALGVRAFERDRRRVLLTTAGSDLVERSRKILAEADNLREAARRVSDPLSVPADRNHSDDIALPAAGRLADATQGISTAHLSLD
jgi:DNA-binding transcriptional ArsR family regulator